MSWLRALQSLLLGWGFVRSHFAHGARQPDDSVPLPEAVLHGRRFFKFVTRPDIDAPIWNIRQWYDGKTHPAPGYIFVSFYDQLTQQQPGDLWYGPHIYDSTGNLIWSGASAFKHWGIFDFGSFEDASAGFITLLDKHDKKGYILDNAYQIRREVPLVMDGETETNMHAFHVINGGKSVLMLTQQSSRVSKEESYRLGSSTSQCLINFQGFREVSLESPEPSRVFEWSSLDHVALDESTYMDADRNLTRACNEGWDMFHFNSIAKFPDGDYILSARHTNTVYKVSHIDGSIVWRLGGRMSDFTFAGASIFSRQHHARVRSQNATHTVVTLFDNAVGFGFNEFPTHESSRALVLELDTEDMTAFAVSEYAHPEKGHTKARGSFQTLPNDNVFICWAHQSLITEHAPYGEKVMQAKLEADIDTYRAFKYPWVGRPIQPPDVVSQAVSSDTGQILTRVFMSWNGATEIASWRVSAIDAKGSSHIIGSEPWQGFETTFTYHGHVKAVSVEALDALDKVLGQSDVSNTAALTEVGSESSVWRHSSQIGEPETNASDAMSAVDAQEHTASQSHLNQLSNTSTGFGNFTTILVLVGLAAVVGFVFGVLALRLFTSWSSWFRKRNREIRYESVRMEDDSIDFGEANGPAISLNNR